ncbi:hypothetical protein GCM10022200_05630 [Microbacterium awajiense]|uniref:Helix-hairpin-helix DNA-binding motif class 1 domain-containing protein n=1 Tax=Microbacterium awajiense TaxID=415214 RepID=A0ABP7A6U4_9MICO
MTSVAPDSGSRRRRLGVGAAIVLGLAAAAVTIGIGVVRTAVAPVATVPVVDESAAASSAHAWVHVTGAVRVPGVYAVDPSARVVDAVAAAGGFTEEADREAVNLARPVADGELLHVPVVGEATATGASDGRVNVNTADIGALDTLPRIGPALAARIVAWRDEHGRFTSVDDLLAVPGIGEAILEGLRELVTV